MNRRSYISCFSCLLFVWAFASAGSAAIPIQYQLPSAARVSMLITDSNGKVVRELLHAAPRPKGVNTETWDGLNDRGRPAPPGKYNWKLLSTQGLKAEYLLTLGTNPAPAWDPWPGNHGGVRSLATDALGVPRPRSGGDPCSLNNLDGTKRF